MKAIFFKLGFAFMLMRCGAQTTAVDVPEQSSDTIINKAKHEVVVKTLHVRTDSAYVSQVKTTLLKESLNEAEQKLVRGGGYNGLNYINSADGDSIEIKDYKIDGHTLTTKVYFTRGPGRFQLGKAELNLRNELILRFGDKIMLDGYDFPVPYYSMELEISIPPSKKVEKVIFLTK